MKNYYIAVDLEKNGKRFAYVKKVSGCENLISALKIPYIISATLCETKEKAEKVVALWNDIYKDNKTYASPEYFIYNPFHDEAENPVKKYKENLNTAEPLLEEKYPV